jgi:hypothetical protein
MPCRPMSRLGRGSVADARGADRVRDVVAAFRWRESLEVTRVVDGVRWLAGLDPGATYLLRVTASHRWRHCHFGQWWPT